MGGPLLLAYEAKLLRTESQQIRKFLLNGMARVILEIKITNFTANTLRVINYAEMIKVGVASIAALQ